MADLKSSFVFTKSMISFSFSFPSFPYIVLIIDNRMLSNCAEKSNPSSFWKLDICLPGEGAEKPSVSEKLKPPFNNLRVRRIFPFFLFL